MKFKYRVEMYFSLYFELQLITATYFQMTDQ